VTKKPGNPAPLKRKKRKKESSNALYAGIVGCALLAAKIYFGSEVMPRRDIAGPEDGAVGSAENNPHGASNGSNSQASRGNSPQSSGDSQRFLDESNNIPSAASPLTFDQCRTPEHYQCTRKVFNPEIKDADDGTSENATSCVSTGEENICVQMKTVWNSTSHFQNAPDSKKADFESGGRYNHEEYQCAFYQFGQHSNLGNQTQGTISGITIRVEGRELAQALRSLQKDCIARADQPTENNGAPNDDSDRAVAGADPGAPEQNQNGNDGYASDPQQTDVNNEAQVPPVSAEIAPDQSAQIPPQPVEMQSAPGEVPPQMTPGLGSNDPQAI